MWTDTHCHLQYEGMAADAVDEAAAAGVERIVCVGTDAAHSTAAAEIAEAHPGRVWATAGIHPHDASQGIDGLSELLDRSAVVAIGECGLDYHYDHSPRHVQRDVFVAQAAMARDRDLALVVHTRDAWDDTFRILASEAVPARTVLHCFSGGPAEAERALAWGAHLSFSGIVTFKNADDVRAAARITPLDRLLVETDAPFLAPAPHRGQTNRPAWVTLVGEAVARVKEIDVERVEEVTTANAERVLGLAADRAPSAG